jgi:hypothetical protein
MDDVRKLVKVKPLVFGKWGEAKGGGAKYSVYETGAKGGWNSVCYPHEDQQYRLAEDVFRDEAEAAAQADYEARIYAALTPASDGRADGLREAAAWHESEIAKLNENIAANNEYLARMGHPPDIGSANLYCRDKKMTHEISRDAILARAAELEGKTDE